MHRRLLSAALLSIAFASTSDAQVTAVRPHLDWRTVNTRHFAVHYPREMEAWALDLAGQVDAVRDAVSALVGFAPARRVNVIVEDPANVSNGSAYPDPDGPAILVWPNPPEPGDVIGQSRSWAEILGVHEYAHVAHLIRETRNPRQRFLWRISPVTVPAVLRKAPRWLFEGYATYVEGKLTGSGRPHGAARPAVLRQWALEGRMPTYAQLNGTAGYLGGTMAYLAGSAYLEWLVEQRGDSSLVHLWRRMSARVDRDFTSAFMGVYGAPPDELYGRFVVELTERAIETRRSLAAAGIVAGELVQRRRWSTGEPTLSRDGSFMAVSLASPTQPARIVVWRTVERVDTAAERKARERMLELDPEDVPAVRSEPRPKRALATLHPRQGIAFDAPRFLPDGQRLLVSHLERTGDGSLRPDLFVWTPRDGRVRRVTRGASVRYADPTPDGRGAIGVRCVGGACDVVAVDLASGDVRVVRRGTVREPMYRPRVAPDGRSVVLSVQQGSRWRLARLDLPNGDSLRWLGPDDSVSRYDASFEPDGRTVVYVSEAGGIANLERLDLATGATRTLTRVTSSVSAPEPARGADSGAVYFLQLHARGIDLRRLARDSAATGGVVATDPRLAPATRVPPVAADTFARVDVASGDAYGFGPRSLRWYPGGMLGADGAMAMLAVAGMDPVGRFTWLAQGGIGHQSQWRGGSIEAAWRRFRPAIEGSVFWTQQRRSEQSGIDEARIGGIVLPLAIGPDLTFMGATLSAAAARDMGLHFETARLGVVAGRMERKQRAFLVDGCDCTDPPIIGERIDRAEGSRAFGYAELGAGLRLRDPRVSADLSLVGHGARGRTRGFDWYRLVTTASASVRAFGFGVRADGAYGLLDGRRLRDPFAAPNDVLRDEAFAIGGSPSPFADRRILSHLIDMPALPAGIDYGDDVYWGRLSTSLGPLRPYYWIGGAHFRERLIGDEREWKRVIGLEQEYAFSRIPFLSLPTVVLRVGAGYSLDEPFRRKGRVYANVDFRP